MMITTKIGHRGTESTEAIRRLTRRFAATRRIASDLGVLRVLCVDRSFFSVAFVPLWHRDLMAAFGVGY